MVVHIGICTRAHARGACACNKTLPQSLGSLGFQNSCPVVLLG